MWTPKQSRRDFLAATTCAVAGINSATGWCADPAGTDKTGVTFSFGLYGMKGVPLDEAIKAVASIGYDGVELTARTEWGAAPNQLSARRRRELQSLLKNEGLLLTALMENVSPSADAATHGRQLEQWKKVTQLAHDLAPEQTPVLQTVIGGGEWEQKRSLFVDRLSDWAEIAESSRTILCIKPHRGGAMSRPEQAVWLIHQFRNTPWIRMVYDYSHYAYRGMRLADTIRASAAYTAHIAIKDVVRTERGTTFVLPGVAGTIDYGALFTGFYAAGYRDDICCEVSSAVWRQSDYNPQLAARACYKNIAPVFELSNVPRRRR